MMTTTNIFGFDFICEGDYEGLAQQVIHDVENKNIVITNFITPNAHGINSYLEYPELNEFCKRSRYVLPDGQPLVWLSKLTPNKIAKRLTGSDFFPVIFKKLKDIHANCMFVVSDEIVKSKLQFEMPKASFVVPVFFEMNETDKIKETGKIIAAEIQAKEINYIFIGISEPKQGALAQAATLDLRSKEHQGPCIFFFLGASYEFYLGLKKRAPVIFQKTGLEWFYRLVTEPKRMYKRYIFGNAKFILRSLKWAVHPAEYRSKAN